MKNGEGLKGFKHSAKIRADFFFLSPQGKRLSVMTNNLHCSVSGISGNFTITIQTPKKVTFSQHLTLLHHLLFPLVFSTFVGKRPCHSFFQRSHPKPPSLPHIALYLVHTAMITASQACFYSPITPPTC